MFGNTIGEGGTHGEILEKIWCRVDLTNNTYIPMSEEEICEFFKIFGAVKDEGKPAELDLLNDYQIGLISQKELNSAIGAIGLSNYLDAREKFHNKYDYYPIKVPRYGLDGIDTVRFLKGEPK